jgi:hypothetical protein
MVDKDVKGHNKTPSKVTTPNNTATVSLKQHFPFWNLLFFFTKDYLPIHFVLKNQTDNDDMSKSGTRDNDTEGNNKTPSEVTTPKPTTMVRLKQYFPFWNLLFFFNGFLTNSFCIVEYISIKDIDIDWKKPSGVPKALHTNLSQDKTSYAAILYSLRCRY